ncbi:MAG: L-aspartate oxidase, partial [Caulobacteraceae bacterium]
MTERIHFDGVLIVGGGLAGLSAALAAGPRKVMLLAAAPLGEGCSSAWAQGGMAAALGEGDTPQLHGADTLAAGAGLCDRQAVAILTGEGPDAVRRLAALGAPFDRRADGGFAQSLEAAHGRARVARVGGDGAGAAIMACAIAAARAASHIDIREGWRVRRLLTDREGCVRGALAEAGGRLIEIVAPATLLATGGVGCLFALSTNPTSARGEGLALAALAGAEIVDPEFVQFHPTAMDIGADPAPLATEALRGEGATLIGASGETFMARYHGDGDLAPRDIVARAIETERRAGRGAFLDVRSAMGEGFPGAFPTVFAACMARGLDPRRQPIPVIPAAHYHMGGIGADPLGRTSLTGLFVAGECAATGVHGANRLASNSLLEAAVFGRRAGLAAREAPEPGTAPLPAMPAPELPQAVLTALRGRMSRDAGVVRDGAGLAGLVAWVEAMEAIHGSAPPLVTAGLIARAALERWESRGAHFRRDFPAMAQVAVHTTVTMARASSPQLVVKERAG